MNKSLRIPLTSVALESLSTGQLTMVLSSGVSNKIVYLTVGSKLCYTPEIWAISIFPSSYYGGHSAKPATATLPA